MVAWSPAWSSDRGTMTTYQLPIVLSKLGKAERTSLYACCSSSHSDGTEGQETGEAMIETGPMSSRMDS